MKIPRRFRKAHIFCWGEGIWYWRPIRGEEAWWSKGPYKTENRAKHYAEKAGLKVVRISTFGYK